MGKKKIDHETKKLVEKKTMVAETPSGKGAPQFGSAKGKFVVAADFEETPEDLDEYVE